MPDAVAQPDSMRVRRRTVEHPFGTLKFWMGAVHFLTRTLPRVSTEMSLRVLAYNLKRVMQILGIGEMLRVLRGLSAVVSKNGRVRSPGVIKTKYRAER